MSRTVQARTLSHKSKHPKKTYWGCSSFSCGLWGEPWDLCDVRRCLHIRNIGKYDWSMCLPPWPTVEWNSQSTKTLVTKHTLLNVARSRYTFPPSGIRTTSAASPSPEKNFALISNNNHYSQYCQTLEKGVINESKSVILTVYCARVFLRSCRWIIIVFVF